MQVPMQTLYVVVASASGLALGFATASHLASSAKAALSAKLKDETSALNEAQSKLKELKAAEAKGAGGSGGGKGGGKGKNKKSNDKKSNDKDTKKIEKQIADANRELERLKNSQMATEKAHADALAKVEGQLADAKAETQAAVEAAIAEAASAAEASAAEAAPAVAAPIDDTNADLIAALGSAGASLDAILATLVDHEGQTGALLGDINGIVVAKAGDSDVIENTAAASNTLVSLPQRLDGMLPMNQHFTFALQDGKNAISGKAFESEGELLAITTVGAKAPKQSSLNAVAESIMAALS
tara:strand:- start:5057 stop:5953 length:897 start_codon:yes stop_codon:yes gene_type:complete